MTVGSRLSSVWTVDDATKSHLIDPLVPHVTMCHLRRHRNKKFHESASVVPSNSMPAIHERRKPCTPFDPAYCVPPRLLLNVIPGFRTEPNIRSTDVGDSRLLPELSWPEICQLNHRDDRATTRCVIEFLDRYITSVPSVFSHGRSAAVMRSNRASEHSQEGMNDS